MTVYRSIACVLAALASFMANAGIVNSSISGRSISTACQDALPPLPDGIVAVKYIESTGIECIDTEIMPGNSNCGLILRFQVVDYNDGCCGVTYAGHNLYINFFNKMLYVRYGSFISNSTYGKPWVDAGIYDLYGWNSVMLYDSKVTINDIVVLDGIDYGASITANRRILLFCLGYTGTGASIKGRYFAKIRMSNAQILKDGEVMFNAIAVRFTNGSNQTEGALYDFVSGQLFTNIGEGSFLIGPDK